MKLYELCHEYKTGPKLKYTEKKLIGIFRNKRTIRYFIKLYKDKPGFNEFIPRCFKWRRIAIKDEKKDSEANVVYEVQIWHEETNPCDN